MNREIKFRAWDGANMQVENFDLSSTGRITAGPMSLKAQRHILMQFTGLHDKNGNEIYEGDVVAERLMLGDSYTMNYPVVWDQRGMFAVNNYPITHFYEIEVIGNIYENPELLKS
jgi:hypothetical protein